jgi:hypothetical protein
MRSSPVATGPLAAWSDGDGNDLAVFDRIVAVYEVGENSVVVETDDGREIRITAWRDLSTHEYVAEYERRGAVRSGGNELQIWVHTPAYRRCTADDMEACIEAALFEVDRVRLY